MDCILWIGMETHLYFWYTLARYWQFLKKKYVFLYHIYKSLILDTYFLGHNSEELKKMHNLRKSSKILTFNSHNFPVLGERLQIPWTTGSRGRERRGWVGAWASLRSFRNPYRWITPIPWLLLKQTYRIHHRYEGLSRFFLRIPKLFSGLRP